jgi:hypothetical protein
LISLSRGIEFSSEVDLVMAEHIGNTFPLLQLNKVHNASQWMATDFSTHLEMNKFDITEEQNLTITHGIVGCSMAHIALIKEIRRRDINSQVASGDEGEEWLQKECTH